MQTNPVVEQSKIIRWSEKLAILLYHTVPRVFWYLKRVRRGSGV